MADGRTGGERDDYLKSRLDALRCERMSPDAAVAVMACSRFVLAPRGHMLHSSRLLEALSIGAVPVVVSDGWVLPFEHDLVDWAAVAIRVAEADAGRVADILRTVSDERWCAMQRAGRRAAQGEHVDTSSMLNAEGEGHGKLVRNLLDDKNEADVTAGADGATTNTNGIPSEQVGPMASW